MNQVNRIYYALRRIENKSVAAFGYGDWMRLVRPDGSILPRPTQLNALKVRIASVVRCIAEVKNEMKPTLPCADNPSLTR